MGNNKTKIDDKKLQYKIKGTKNLITINLEEQYDYPQKPADKKIDDLFREILTEIEIPSEYGSILEKLSSSYKWKIVVRHRNFLSQKLNDLQFTEKSEAFEYLIKLKNSPSIQDIQLTRKWLSGVASHKDIETFFILDGINILLSLLETEEICSRQTKNYLKQLEILKNLEVLTRNDRAIDKIIKNTMGVTILFLNYHPLHVDLTSTLLDLLSTILWNSSEEGLDLILDAIGKYRKEKGFKARFEPFIETLNESKNIIIIENTLAFILSLISSQIDGQRRAALKSEFLDSGIQASLENVRQKILDEKYSIQDCTFEATQKLIKKVKENEREKTIREPLKKQFTISEFAAKQEDIEEYETRSRQEKRLVDHDALVKFRNSLKNTKEDEAIVTRAKESVFKKPLARSATSIAEKSFYLEESDRELFQEHLAGVIHQIEAFEKIEYEDDDEGHNYFSEETQKNFSKKRRINQIDLSDLNQVTAALKESALKSDSYTHLLMIVQTFLQIPPGDSGKALWKGLENVCKELISNSEKLENKYQELMLLISGQKSFHEYETIIENMETKIFQHEKEISSLVKSKSIIEKELAKKDFIPGGSGQQTHTNAGVSLAPNLGIPVAQNLGIPSAPNFGIPSAPNLGIPSAPNLGIPGAPNLGIPGAPNLGIPGAPNLGIPGAPNLGIPGAPNLGIPGAPNLGIPGAPNLGIPGAPNLGIPGAPNLGIPGAPNLGIPGAPNLGIPGAPNLGIPGAPNLGIPGAPSLGIPGAPSLGIPGAPSLGIPGAPSLGIPGAPSFGLPGAPSIGLPGAPSIGLPGLPGLGVPSLNLGGPALPGLGIQAPSINQKAKREPRIPMKNLMWNTITTNVVKESIWDKIDDLKVKLDLDNLEKEFGAKKVEVNEAKEGAANTKKKEEQKITVLPAERGKNFELVLGKLKLPNDLIVKALLECDEQILNLSTLESLINICPNESEVSSVENCGVDIAQLANPEKFTLEISKVKGFTHRVNALKFAKTYFESTEDIEEKLRILYDLWSGIPNDKRFLRILEHVLAIGNYLNGKSARGGAYGFKLDSLEKVAEMKAANNKTTLLMYVISQLEKEDGGNPFIDENEDLGKFDLGSKLPLSQLVSDLGEIRKGYNSLTNAIKSQSDAPSDKISEKLISVEKRVAEIIDRINKKIQDCEKAFKAACKLLCENEKDGSDKFTEKLFKFWNNCRRAKRDLIKEEQNQKKEEEKKRLQEEKIRISTTEKPKVLAKEQKPPTLVINGTFNSLKKAENSAEILDLMRNRRKSKNVLLSKKKELNDKAPGKPELPQPSGFGQFLKV